MYTFTFKKMHLKMSSGEWRPFCVGLNVLTEVILPQISHGMEPFPEAAVYESNSEIWLGLNKVPWDMEY